MYYLLGYLCYFAYLCLKTVNGSTGDGSLVFNECLEECWIENCTNKNDQNDTISDIIIKPIKIPFDERQPLHLRLLGWSCIEECKYECMWLTVDIFHRIYKFKVPQFYGKWPFIRVFGIQEPVSVLASVLNLISNLYMINKMRKRMLIKAPFKLLWNSFGMVCVNAWIWSSIFHTRDTLFTEMMDYFSAFALILFQFNSFFVRVLKLRKSPNAQFLRYSINLFCMMYYLYHIYYLSSVKFDYGYNMKMNIIFGALNSLCWIVWSIYNYYANKMHYVWRCALSVILFDVFMTLEVFDFSPIFWSIDSHALWHITTVIIPFFWYQFLIDDNYYIELAYHNSFDFKNEII